ncbi:imidazole glycerol phosphate synthase subunit HisF [Colwellia sp. 75C3]|uniref:imidazole glycerol phosphate synthase subunit HisF n=1 Tax=Colwellia sp. 75C3 TaxID=888425 RepID=UPI000C3389F1|nr:HisA/HisF-related TIM barrel protein [Colwellia sp. 75C3]PKG81124.1 imidazole glycerol phosphate synthase subunit HisF [Colwellia sp. 75C3]
MLRHRVIPLVLIDGFSVLKTINFNERRNLGSPITVARTYNTRNIDELILLDIDASKDERSIDKFTVMDIASELFMPLTVGGGIKTLSDIEQVLKMGADKVAINSIVVEDIKFLQSAAAEFGKQCLVVSIDVIKENDVYKVYSHGKRCSLPLDLFEFCQSVEQNGAGELLINSVDLDGKQTGVDLSLATLISDMVSIPVIIAGGVSSPKNCAEAIQAGASAVAAASLFHFTSFTPDDCREEMALQGIPVRNKAN